MKKLAISIGLAATFVAPSVFAQERPAPPTGRIEPAAEPRPAPPTGREEGVGEREFGNPGVIAFGAGTSANFGYTQDSPPTGSSSNTIDISLAPDVQYFVIEGLSVGGTILFDWKKPNQGDAVTTIGIGPTVGYNLWLSPGSLSLWPQATFSFNNTNISIPNATGGGSQSGSLQTMTVGVFVPLLIHPVKHFHFGVGPYFSTDVSAKASVGSASADSDKFMNVGIRLDIGGWL